MDTDNTNTVVLRDVLKHVDGHGLITEPLESNKLSTAAQLRAEILDLHYQDINTQQQGCCPHPGQGVYTNIFPLIMMQKWPQTGSKNGLIPVQDSISWTVAHYYHISAACHHQRFFWRKHPD